MADDWFVVNVRDSPWVTGESFGSSAIFEDDDREFPQVGYTLAVLQPGKPSGLYHRESNQEDFLVLRGTCTLLVEGEERQLREWDFVHCPAWTEHIFVGSGDEPCVIFMTGARTREKEIVYPESQLAQRHGAGAERETTVSRDAYAPFAPWQPGRPDGVWD
jgi:uncharacterized cupin superfamily protein